jgi:replicative DNA helicase
MRCNVSVNMLNSPEAKEMFREIIAYYRDQHHYGRVPTARYMKDRFPSFDHLQPKETVEELCEEIRKNTIRKQIMETCEKAQYQAVKDPYKALSGLRSDVLLTQALTSSSRDIIFEDTVEEVIEEYSKDKNSSGISGVPYPWPQMNKETRGMQQEDFIIFFARPKSYKSWLSLYIAIEAYAAHNCRVMYYSCEMNEKLIRKRAACIIAGVDFQLAKTRELPPKSEKLYYAALRDVKQSILRQANNGHSASFLLTHFMDDPSVGGVGHMMAKAEIFKPDLIIVDSFYRMKNDRTGKISNKPADQYAITQDLKNATQRLQVPIIGVTQRNREGEKEQLDDIETSRDIAFTDATGQESDLFIRFIKGEEQPDGSTNIIGKIAGAREIRASGMLLQINPATKWDFVSWLSSKGTQIGQTSAPVLEKRNNSINKVPKTDPSITPEKSYTDFIS